MVLPSDKLISLPFFQVLWLNESFGGGFNANDDQPDGGTYYKPETDAETKVCALGRLWICASQPLDAGAL
jgi:hypothetical protein